MYEAAIAGVPSVSRSAGPVDGVTVVLAAHPLASGDAVVVVTMDRDEAVLPAARLAANLVAAGAVSLTMVAAFSMYLSGSISRPLRDLAHVSDRIRGGDSSIRVAVTGDDDLARLSKNVNALADALIAANRDLEQRVKDRTEALERSNQDLEQFAYVSSHDLQEPLRSVAGFVELLERRLADKMGDDDRKFVGYIVDATKRMQTLINDLLTYSRVNRRPAEPTEVDLAELVGGIRRSLDAAVRRTGADIRVGPMPAILADRLQMEQLFQNIIANGIKFHGEAPPIVDVSSHRADDRWVFEVRDNGIGMEPRHLEKIFVIFQRLHGRAEYEGTGIGLAICKKIVEAHGGTIAVESEPGKGTTFRFSITGGDTGPQEPQHLVYRPVQPGFAERGSELV